MHRETLQDLSRLCLSARFCSSLISSAERAFCIPFDSFCCVVSRLRMSFISASRSSAWDFKVKRRIFICSWLCISSSIIWTQKDWRVYRLCYGKPITELGSVNCHTRSHSVTGHPTQVNVPHLNTSQTGRYLIYQPRRDGRRSRPWWLVLYWDGLPAADSHPSKY